MPNRKPVLLFNELNVNFFPQPPSITIKNQYIFISHHFDPFLHFKKATYFDNLTIKPCM